MHPFTKAQMDAFEFSMVEWVIQVSKGLDTVLEQGNCLSFVGCVLNFHSFQNVLNETVCASEN